MLLDEPASTRLKANDAPSHAVLESSPGSLQSDGHRGGRGSKIDAGASLDQGLAPA